MRNTIVMPSLSRHDRIRLASRLSPSAGGRIIAPSRLARLGNWMWDPSTDRVTWPEPIERLLGQPAGATAPAYTALLRAVHPAGWARVHRMLRDDWRRRVPLQLDFRVR